MRKTLSAVALLLACAAPSDAHQLDGYLQATRIAVEPTRIALEIALTPGVAVAPQIFASIDRDGDRVVSPDEIETFGRVVLRGLVLEVDGRPLRLTLARGESPAWAEMRDGLGAIRLRASADVSVVRGRHELRFVNNYRSDIGVYLVNALMPSSRTISIGEQRRDAHQQSLQLRFDVSGAYVSAGWIFFPFVGLGALMIRRSRPRLGSVRSLAGRFHLLVSGFGRTG